MELVKPLLQGPGLSVGRSGVTAAGVHEVVKRVVPRVEETAQGKESADGGLVLLNQAPPFAEESAASVQALGQYIQRNVRILADIGLEILRQNRLDRDAQSLRGAENVSAGHENRLAAIAAAVAAHGARKLKRVAGFQLVLLEASEVNFGIGHAVFLPLFGKHLNGDSDLLARLKKPFQFCRDRLGRKAAGEGQRKAFERRVFLSAAGLDSTSSAFP